MITGILVAAAVFGVVALTLLLIFRKDLLGVDLGTRSMLRLYLYIASLAGVILVVIGVAAIIDWGAANVFGVVAVYGRPGIDPYAPASASAQMAEQNALRSQMDVLRGITLAVVGALVWGGHRFARRLVADGDENASLLRHAYDVLGTFVFGLGTIVLLPVGIYLALSAALLTPGAGAFMQGFGDSLAGGIVCLPVWLVYLFSVIRALPAKVPTTSLRAATAH